MTKPTRLTDLQRIMLSTASARPDGSLFPMPDSIAEDQDRSNKAITALLKHGLASEQMVTDRAHCWREHDGDRIGLFITQTGIVVIAPDTDMVSVTDAAGQADNAAPIMAPKLSKTALLLYLLRRDNGASIDELIAATHWLPHTTRAALTGLRKKGHDIVRAKIDGTTHYMISPSVVA
jgi:hypothetical protein